MGACSLFLSNNYHRNHITVRNLVISPLSMSTTKKDDDTEAMDTNKASEKFLKTSLCQYYLAVCIEFHCRFSSGLIGSLKLGIIWVFV